MPSLGAFASLLLPSVLANYQPLKFPACNSLQYFDVSALACLPCPEGQEVDAVGTGCICADQHVLNGDTCEPCGAGTAPTSDRTACMPCVIAGENRSDATLGLDSESGECTCPAGTVLLERNAHGGLLPAKRCQPCPQGKVAASATSCVDCPADNMVAQPLLPGTTTQSCACRAGYVKFDHSNGWWGRQESCIDEDAYDQINPSYDRTNAKRMTYRDLPESQGGTFIVDESKIMQQLILPSAAACLVAISASASAPREQPLLVGNQACQALGNLCVLQDYDQRSEACTLYVFLRNRAGQDDLTLAAATFNQNTEWRARMPGLYYPPGVAALTETAPEIPTRFALPPKTGSRLRYVIASYSLNGTYLGMAELTNQLQLCTGGATNPSAFLDFGTSMDVSCDVPPVDLLASTEPVLHDLFLYFDTNAAIDATARLEDITSSTARLYPVPVRLRNLREDGQPINKNRPIFDDQLTRRFFVVDAASGVRQGGELPAVLRYLKSAKISHTLRAEDAATGVGTNRLLPPVLEIEYGEVAISSSAGSPLAADAALREAGVSLPHSFEAVYTQEMDNANATINYLFVICMVVWFLATIGKAVFFFRRNRASVVDGVALLRLLAMACNVFAATFFTLIWAISLWWTITFKGQEELYLLLPILQLPDDGGDPLMYLGLMPFQTFLVACLCGQICHIIDLLYVQTQHDLYLIDWEQPRSLRTDAADDDDAADKEGGASSGQGGSSLPVSVWRTIFVANEWVKLQSVRSVSVEINLIVLLFFLQGIGLEQSATLQPNGDPPPEAGIPYHMLLRFAISSSLLLAISLAQWLFRYVFWERFVKDRIWQFVDLLAVTNVSCLLLEERHFGFYLHGRSVHDHADADMAQLNANLKREEGGLEMLRGFRQESAVQTFEIYISPKVRQKYDNAFLGGGYGEAYPTSRTRAVGGPPSGGKRSRGFRAAPSEAVHRMRELNRFLMRYLGTPSDPGGGDGGAERPEVRKKGYFEQLLGLPPDMGYSIDRSVFLEDTTGRFKRLLLAGRELDMVLLSLLTYAVVDMGAENTFSSIFVTYAVDVLVRAVRAELASRNIANKTLLDDRFLL